MPSTFIEGTVNLASLTVPGTYIDIIPPTPFVVGAPTNRMGIVGVAQWGPVGAPVAMSTPDDCAGYFGKPVVRSYDMPTYVWAGSQQGSAVAWYGVRVTDTTDVAATATVQTNCLTLTGKYTGSLGNQISFVVATGSQANTFAVSISFPGRVPETYNNIPGTGNTFWVNVAAAINNGNVTRGASQWVTASAGAGTTAPTLGTSVTLSGGTDGATGVTPSMLLGSDTLPRKGMYALRATLCDAFALCDVTDVTTWTSQASFALNENMLAVLTTASGDSIANATASRVTNALDYFYAWLIMGDWPSFNDQQNGYVRLVSPQAAGLALLGNLSPEQSPLNKQLNTVVQTQRSIQSIPYSDADISIAELGGIDLIVPPANTPGGNYFSFITGRNSSSNTAGNGIEYSRMTFFLARSFKTVGGKFVGKLQSVQANDPTRLAAWFAYNSFMSDLATPALGSGGYGMIDQWQVICDLTNNTPTLQARGFLFVYVTVRYLNVVRYFVIKLAGGGNVVVTTQNTVPSAAQFS